MNYDQVNTQYMQEVKDYLAKVANGRRVAGYDPQAQQFSPQAEDQRQAKALGVPYQADPRLAQIPTFNTHLPTNQESAFAQWKSQYAPQDSGQDYDLRGAFKAGLQPDAVTGHWPDTFKKPGHPTFSDQSKYAPFGTPGHWQGDTYTPGIPQPTTGRSPQYGFTPSKVLQKTREEVAQDAEYSSNQWMKQASRTPPPGVPEMIAGTNTSFPSFAPKDPQYINKSLTAAGWTVPSGSRKGQVFATTGDVQALSSLPNTLAHEGYHQGVIQHGNPYEDTPWEHRGLAKRMSELQPDSQYGPYWGLHPTSNKNEMLASLKGYEGSLPKGTALGETEVGKRLFDKAGFDEATGQQRKNYYYKNISYPQGGLWEGQDDHNIPSRITLLKEAIVNKLTKGY